MKCTKFVDKKFFLYFTVLSREHQCLSDRCSCIGYISIREDQIHIFKAARDPLEFGLYRKFS